MRPFRSVVILGLVAAPIYLVATRSSGERHASASPPDLVHLEALAGYATGAHDDLSVAIAIGERRSGAWEMHDYPEADAALAALGRWAQSRDPLPPRQHDFSLYRLGKLAIATPGSLELGQRVGYRFVTEGRNLLEAMLGTSLLRQAVDRARELGQPRSTSWVPPPETFARVLAAEALAVARHPAEQLSRDEATELVAFWTTVLGNNENEPAATTLDRFERTPKPSTTPQLASMVRRFARELVELQRAPSG